MSASEPTGVAARLDGASCYHFLSYSPCTFGDEVRVACSLAVEDVIAPWVAMAERSRRRWNAAGPLLAERRPPLLSELNALYARSGAQSS